MVPIGVGVGFERTSTPSCCWPTMETTASAIAAVVEPGAPSLESLSSALYAAWESSTSSKASTWSASNAAWGQCAVTALVVQGFCGGALVRGIAEGESHYWNRLSNGAEVDLTRHQFEDGVSIRDVEPTSRAHVLSVPDTRRRYERLKSLVLKELD